MTNYLLRRLPAQDERRPRRAFTDEQLERVPLNAAQEMADVESRGLAARIKRGLGSGRCAMDGRGPHRGATAPALMSTLC